METEKGNSPMTGRGGISDLCAGNDTSSYSARKSAPLKAARGDSTGGLLPPFQISFPAAGRRRLCRYAPHGLYLKTFHLSIFSGVTTPSKTVAMLTR
ncbi:hypothetical protein, partial [Schaedlerella arabinosiphila]|uniref:hypothetical protein n=1 Tax=Schaedlerella arabinosiphila TaxID=2044587 RepID=UPI002557D4B6